MPRKKTKGPTRQLFAAIREDIYLEAKARSAERRISMRTLLEQALTGYLQGNVGDESYVDEIQNSEKPTIWDDEYIGMQAYRPIGTPVEISEDEARRIAREAFL